MDRGVRAVATPRLASPTATPAPMPRDAPVTTATFPARGRVYSTWVEGDADMLKVLFAVPPPFITKDRKYI